MDTTSGDYQTGFAPYLYTIKGGMRWTPADAYLKRRYNLHVALKAHVHKVLVDHNHRAVGVKVSHRGHVRNVYAKREVGTLVLITFASFHNALV